MKRTLKSALVLIMTMAILISLPVFATTASANDGGMQMTFYKPAGWSDNIKVHIWNSGTSYNTTWPGVAMTNNGDGTFSYDNSAIGNGCNVVIHDSNGQQTSDLYIPAYSQGTTVKDNKVVEAGSATVNFKKPSTWGTNLYMYYYSNDAQEMEIVAWPGEAMSFAGDNWYAAPLKGMKNASVIFTDGVNQYPSAMQAGVSITATGQEVWVKDGNTYNTNPEDEYGNSLEAATLLGNPLGSFTGRRNTYTDRDFVKFVAASDETKIYTYDRYCLIDVYDASFNFITTVMAGGYSAPKLNAGSTYYLELRTSGIANYNFSIMDESALRISGAYYSQPINKIPYMLTKDSTTVIIGGTVNAKLYDTNGNLVMETSQAINGFQANSVFRQMYIDLAGVTFAPGYKMVFSATGGNTGNVKIAQPYTYTFS